MYGDIATNLLQHRIYGITVDGVVHPTLIRLPGYPLFLAGCFLLFGKGNFLAVVWIQILLDLGSCVLLGLLAKDLRGTRAGLWAVGLSALCPFTANYSVVPLTEELSIFCAALAFFSFERWLSAMREGDCWNHWLWPLILSITFALLLRPDRALLGAVVVLALASATSKSRPWSVRALAPAVAAALVFLSPLILWGVRNWRVFHVVQPLSPKYANDPDDVVALGFMQWYRTWGIDYKNTVEVYWPYDGSTVNFTDVPARAFDSPEQRQQTKHLFAEYNDETSSTPEVDTAFAALAKERISASPLRYYLLLPLARLTDMWLQPRTELLKIPLDWWRWRQHAAGSAFSYAYVILNAGLLALGASGFTLWRRDKYSQAPVLAYALLAFVLLRSLLLATLDNAEQRYTIDSFPVILLLASFACAKFFSSAECDLQLDRSRMVSC